MNSIGVKTGTTEKRRSLYMKRILLVDDDKDILNINSIHLQGEGHICLVAETAEQAYAIIELENPDLIILDILLPDGTGIDICKEIRNYTIAPIIFLTSLLGDAKKIEALQIGGDDYMTKPYKLAELSARVQANLRRIQMHQSTLYEFPPLKINIGTYRVFLHNKEVFLTQKEIQLLMILIRNRGTIVTKEYLLQQIWGNEPNSEANIKSLHVHVSSLRKKIIPGESSEIGIKTIRNIGYCFEYEGDGALAYDE